MGNVRLTFTPTSTTVGIKILREDIQIHDLNPVTPGVSTQWTDVNAVQGILNTYKVRPYDLSGNINTTDTDGNTESIIPTGTPLTQLSAPGTFAAVADGSAAIDLSWVDVANETNYLIEVSANGTSGWATLSSPAANATTATQTGLTASTQKFYRIKAVGDGVTYSDSNWSTANATTDAGSSLNTIHYQSDFATDVSGFAGNYAENVLTHNIDGILGRDNCLRIGDSRTSGDIVIATNRANGLADSVPSRIKFQIYIPTGTAISTINLNGGYGVLGTYTPAESWQEVDFDLLSPYGYTPSFTTNVITATASNPVFYIREVVTYKA